MQLYGKIVYCEWLIESRNKRFMPCGETECSIHPGVTPGHFLFAMKNELTYEEAHKLFRYDAETGKLFGRVSRGNVKACAEAGSVKRSGRRQYRHVMLRGKRYLVHRIIWLMLYGEWPKHDIDHVDGNGTNNRPSNLRDVSRTVNLRNARMHSDNTSGVNGVCFYKRTGKWRAQSCDGDGRRKHLGYHDSIADAERAVLDYQASLGFTARHGKEAV